MIASGSQASVRLRQPKKIRWLPAWVHSATKNQPALALVVGILGTLSILRTLMTLMQLTGLGQAGAGGEGVARPVVGEAQEQGIASAPHPQLGASLVMDQPMRERPVSQNRA